MGAEEFINRRSFGVWRRYRRVGVDFGEVIVRFDLGLGSLVSGSCGFIRVVGSWVGVEFKDVVGRLKSGLET